jgi:hypothetical protein
VELLGVQRLGHAVALGIEPNFFIDKAADVVDDHKTATNDNGNGSGSGTGSDSDSDSGTAIVHRRTETVDERLDQIAYDLRHSNGLRAVGIPIDDTALRHEIKVLEAKRDEAIVAETKRKATIDAAAAAAAPTPSTSDGKAKDNGTPIVAAPITIEYTRGRFDIIRRRQQYACERIRDAGSIVEVCPASNRRIGGFVADATRVHQMHRLHQHGVPFVVCSDDPGLLNVKLVDELEWVVTHLLPSTATHDERHQLRRTLVQRSWDARSEIISKRVVSS